MTLISWALPIGLATGLAAWLLAGGASASFEKLDGVDAELAALHPPMRPRPVTFSSGGELLTAPLFALTTGPGAVREPAIRLDGLSLSRRRMAALVSIDGRSAAWLKAGETADGVTLQTVTASSATFETAVGVRTLNLGDQAAASAPAAGGAAPTPTSTPSAASADQPPPGLRRPPEPASAPVRR